MEDQEFEVKVKPLILDSEEKFQQMATELLSKLDNYKRLKSRIDLLDSTCKNYMLTNEMNRFENKAGVLTIVKQKRQVISPEFIDEIEKYKVNKVMMIMYKSAN